MGENAHRLSEPGTPPEAQASSASVNINDRDVVLPSCALGENQGNWAWVPLTPGQFGTAEKGLMKNAKCNREKARLYNMALQT